MSPAAKPGGRRASAAAVSASVSGAAVPNLQDLGRLRIGENVEELLKADLALEKEAIPCLREAIALCEDRNDFVSRALLVSILENEEEHEDWLETQIGLIGKTGFQNYVQSQMTDGE